VVDPVGARIFGAFCEKPIGAHFCACQRIKSQFWTGKANRCEYAGCGFATRTPQPSFRAEPRPVSHHFRRVSDLHWDGLSCSNITCSHISGKAVTQTKWIVSGLPVIQTRFQETRDSVLQVVLFVEIAKEAQARRWRERCNQQQWRAVQRKGLKRFPFLLPKPASMAHERLVSRITLKH
jgi:hypothetical protein